MLAHLVQEAFTFDCIKDLLRTPGQFFYVLCLYELTLSASLPVFFAMTDLTLDSDPMQDQRPSNQSTTDALLESIRAVSGEKSLNWARPPVPLTGGFWAEMWRVRLLPNNGPLAGDLVARVMPDPEVARRETEVQDHLAKHGFSTPAVRLSSPPGPHLERAWMLMDYAQGKPLLSALSGAATVANLPQFARSMPDALARDAAALHAIDPEPLIAKHGTRDLLAELRDQTVEAGLAELTAAVDQLARERPKGGPVVICHGDLHPFNVLSHPTGDTILDWSTTRLTGPEYDLAFTRLLFSYFPLPAPRILAPVMGAAGRAVARRFTQTYDRIGPRPIDRDRLSWFTKLQALRIVTEVGVWYASGGPEDDNHPFLIMAPGVQHYLGLDLAYL